MVWFGPKTLLKWREPRVGERMRAERAIPLPWYYGPLMVLVSFGLAMLAWALARINPQKNPPPLEYAISIALFGSVFLYYGMAPLLELLTARATVRVTVKGLWWHKYHYPREWNYPQIDRCRISMAGEGDTVYCVLEIVPVKARPFILAVAPEISSEELRRALGERGVIVESE
jgi:hypothetical protein